MKRLCVLITAVMLSAGVVCADGHAAARLVMQQAIDRLTQRLDAEAEMYAEDEQRLYLMLEEEVLPVVDMHLIGRLVLGRHWKTAGEAQKKDFIRYFRSMLMKSYGKTLLLLDDFKVEYEPPLPDDMNKKYQIVRTKVVTSSNRPPLSINYSLIEREGWKMFDIIIDGTSIARQFRTGFDREIREVGLDALIARLSQFNGPANGS